MKDRIFSLISLFEFKFVPELEKIVLVPIVVCGALSKTATKCISHKGFPLFIAV